MNWTVFEFDMWVALFMSPTSTFPTLEGMFAFGLMSALLELD